MGTVVLAGDNNILVIRDCLYIPDSITLISVHQITDQGFKVLLESNQATIYRTASDVRENRPFIRSGKRIHEKLWKLDVKPLCPYETKTTEGKIKSELSLANLVTDSISQSSALRFHEAHAHASLPVLKKLYPMFQNIDSLPWCDACAAMERRKAYSKNHRSDDPFPTTETKTFTFDVINDLSNVLHVQESPCTTSKVIASEPIHFESGPISISRTNDIPSSPSSRRTDQRVGAMVDGETVLNDPKPAEIDPFRIGPVSTSRTNDIPSSPSSWRTDQRVGAMVDNDAVQDGSKSVRSAELSLDDPKLIPMPREYEFGESEYEIHTIDLCANLHDAKVDPSFGRYLNSDTKYVKTESVRGYRYLFIVIDKDTRVTFGFLGVNKSDFQPIAKRWLRTFANIYNRYPVWWKFDQGGEFLNQELIDMLERRGIKCAFSTTAAHNQNAFSERKIGVTWTATLKALALSGVPMQFWCYCAIYQIFIQNHLPHSGIRNEIPLNRASMHTHYDKIFTFGCEVWYSDEYAVSNDCARRRGIFLGMSNMRQGYDILDIETRKVISSRNVRFMVDRMPFRLAMQPCKINLDFGTWPTIGPEMSSIPTQVISETSVLQQRGQVIDPISYPIDIIPPTQYISVPYASIDPTTSASSDNIIPVVPDDVVDVDDIVDVDQIDDPKSKETAEVPSILQDVTPIDKLDKGDDSKSGMVLPTSSPMSPIGTSTPLQNFSDTWINDPFTPQVESRQIRTPDLSVIHGSALPSIPENSTIFNPSKLFSSPVSPPISDEPTKAKGKFTNIYLGPKSRFEFPEGTDHFAVDLNAPSPSPIALKKQKSYPKTIGEPQFEIEGIVNRRPYIGGKGRDKFEYQFKWKSVEGGVAVDDDTWYPAANVSTKAIKAYEADHPSRVRKPPATLIKPRLTPSHTYGLRTRRKATAMSLTADRSRLRRHHTKLLSKPQSDNHPTDHVFFGRIPRFANHSNRGNSNRMFAKWNQANSSNRFSSDVHNEPVDELEKGLHLAYDIIAEINSAVHREFTSKRDKPIVTIKDITADEVAQANSILNDERERRDSPFFPFPGDTSDDNTTVFEDVHYTKEFANFVRPRPEPTKSESVNSAESNTNSSYDGEQVEEGPIKGPIKRTPIKRPPADNKRTIRIVKDEITLNEIIALSEIAFANFIESPDFCGNVEGLGWDRVAAERVAVVPESQSKARADIFADEYIEAEKRELAGIHRHGTFEETYCPPGRTPITCRWAYDIKRDGRDGKIKLFKARLVCHGFKQVQGIDFNKTFSSTAQLRTFRFVVGIAVHKGIDLYQYDISNAFLNGKLEEELYMTFPPGYPSKNKDTVVRLLKGLYGLKQASRIWQKTLYESLAKVGLVPCKTESGVLHIPGSKSLCLVVCWVDDLVILCEDPKMREMIEKQLIKDFLVKLLGQLDTYVGIVLDKDAEGRTHLNQSGYNKKVVVKYPVNRKFHANIPAPTDRLSKIDCPDTDEERAKIDYPYISVTGSLLYSAICTRPDIFFAVMQLCRFNSNPGHPHIRASEQCLRYLEETADMGITFTPPSKEDMDKKVPLDIVAFVDSDWGGCPDTRRSTIGYVVQVCGGPVAYRSKLMQTMALSSGEAEFMALTEVCRELMWMCNFLDEIGVEYNTPNIYCDSTTAICWAEDPVQHQRNKHVSIKYYYCRDKVAEGKVIMFKIHTTRNLSDVMTKPVGRQILIRIRPALMGQVKPVFDEA